MLPIEASKGTPNFGKSIPVYPAMLRLTSYPPPSFASPFFRPSDWLGYVLSPRYPSSTIFPFGGVWRKGIRISKGLLRNLGFCLTRPYVKSGFQPAICLAGSPEVLCKDNLWRWVSRCSPCGAMDFKNSRLCQNLHAEPHLQNYPKP